MRRIVLPGLLGFITIMLWTFIANGLLGFSNHLLMMQLDNEPAVYEVLKEYVTEPGAYTVNPAAVPGTGFPLDEPVFHVRYSGFGHEAAGRLVFVDLGIALVASLLVATLLSMASRRVLSSFARKVLFVVLIGLFTAVLDDLTRYGIGGQPLGAALLLAANSLAMWTLAGMVMAGFMPAPAHMPAR